MTYDTAVYHQESAYWWHVTGFYSQPAPRAVFCQQMSCFHAATARDLLFNASTQEKKK